MDRYYFTSQPYYSQRLSSPHYQPAVYSSPVEPAREASTYTNVSGDGSLNLDTILLNPKDCIVLFIDHEPQMYLGMRSTEPQTVRNNTVGLAKACKLFNVPTILTTIDEKSFSGTTLQPILDALGNPKPIDRSVINAWQDKDIVEAVKATGRKKVLISALWTELCGLMPALSAKAQGYEVYYVTDASGGATVEAHNMAIQRMVQAGIIPVTWMQVMLEWQRDWARADTSGEVLKIASEYGGAYGIGIQYHDQIAKGEVVPK